MQHFLRVVNRDQSSNLLSFLENRVLCTHFGDKQTVTDERTDGQNQCVKALSLSSTIMFMT